MVPLSHSVVPAVLDGHGTKRHVLQASLRLPHVACGSAWLAAQWICYGPVPGCCAGSCGAKPGKLLARTMASCGCQALNLISWLVGTASQVDKWAGHAAEEKVTCHTFISPQQCGAVRCELGPAHCRTPSIFGLRILKPTCWAVRAWDGSMTMLDLTYTGSLWLSKVASPPDKAWWCGLIF